MKRKTAAVYDPYLDTLGGGEKHLLSIVKLLEKQDYAVKIFWDQDLTEVIKNRLNLEFTNLQFYPNIFRQRSWLKKILWLKQIDYFFYISDGSYFFSPAKKNFIFAMVPSYHLYPHNFINKLKTFNYRFISNSQFTYHWLKQWGIESKVIYPVIDPIFLNTPNRVKKEKIILSVGRFFPQLHSKQQTAIITAFNFLIKNNPQFSDWKLILVGGLKTEDSNYLKQLKKQTANNRQIIFAPNLSLFSII
jgi:glycosyltransferase involved in cell wall biosynthesis